MNSDLSKLIIDQIPNASNGVRALVIGDIHFQYQRLLDADTFTECCFKHLDNLKNNGHELDFIVVLGDVFHTHETTKTPVVQKVTDFLTKLTEYTYTYVLVGNHDYINKYQFLTENHAFYPMKQWDLPITIVDKPIAHTIKDKTFVFTPYVPDGRFKEALNNSEVNDISGTWDLSDCIFAHSLFDGLKMGSEVAQSVEKWSEDYPPVINGHLHSMQTANNIYCPGSSTTTTISDCEQKNIWYVIFDTESDDSEFPYFKIKLLSVDTKIKLVKEYTTASIVNFNVDSYPSEKFDIRINLHGTNAEFKLFRKTDLYKTIIKLKHIKIAYINENDQNQSNIKNHVLGNIKTSYCFKDILEELIEISKPSGVTTENIKHAYKEIASYA